MDDRKSSYVLLAVFGLSVVAHLGAWVGLGALPPLAVLLGPPEITEIEIFDEVVVPPPDPEPETPPEPPPEPEPPPQPRPEPRPERRPEPRPEPRPRTDEPPPPAAAPPPVEEQIADFTGETLTMEGPGAWQSAVGNGEDMQGPIGAPTGVVTGRRREGGQEGVVGGTGTTAVEQVVALRDLRQPPVPPDGSQLRAELERRYPPRLRSLSVEGRAVVRVRIRANGDIGRIRVLSASEVEFGDACSNALRQVGGWRAGLRRDGEPAATDIDFTCSFTLNF